MRDTAIGLLLCGVGLACSGGAEVADRPSKGEWEFALEEEWSIEGVTDEPFGRIAELLVLKGGTLHVRDFTSHVSYLLDGSGRQVAAIGRHGEGPGQISRYINRFTAGDELVLAAPEALHFFSLDGTFSRAVPNDLFTRFPLHFLDGSSFIYAPTKEGSSESRARLMRVDLSSGEESLVHDFAEPGGSEAGPEGDPVLIHVVGLTPAVVLGSDGHLLYFGRNDAYTIHVTDMAGTEVRRFGLSRPERDVSFEDKRRHLAESRLPEDRIRDLAGRLPSRLTHFHRIQPLGGLLYVFTTEGLERRHARQGVDVFSTDGEYLYRGSIELGQGRLYGGPANLAIDGDRLYVILEGEDGRRIAKYRIALPAP